MTGECAHCTSGLWHCHGTVIEHVTSWPECTEPDCDAPHLEHVYVIDCVAIGCECSAEDADVNPSGRRFA